MHPPGICAILLRMENNTENEKDSRTRLLIGDEALSRLHDSHILLLGLGGVGSYVCEALCRAGVGRLSLVDSDMVEESNLNRQLYALRSTIGMPKTEAARSRCLDIAPDISIAAYRRFLEAGRFDRNSIMQFSKAIGREPSILLGRLMNDGYVGFSDGSVRNLRRRFRVGLQ